MPTHPSPEIRKDWSFGGALLLVGLALLMWAVGSHLLSIIA